MERIRSVNERVSVNKTVGLRRSGLFWYPNTLVLLPLPPAQPCGLEPAPLRRHDGARRGWPDVLRASQGDGFGSKLPRLHFFPQARPGPRGLSWFPGNSASYQPQGESAPLLFFFFFYCQTTTSTNHSGTPQTGVSYPLCVFFQGDVMFRNWRSIFNGDGGPINARIPIYSFDGRDVLADPFWSVNFINSLPVCLCLLCLSVVMSIFSVIHLSGLRRVSGTAPPAGGSEWWTNTVRRGERTTCLSRASHRAWPRVCSWASRRGAVPTSTSSCASRPTKTLNSPFPQYHSITEPIPATVNVQHSGKNFECLPSKRMSFSAHLCSILWFLKKRGPHSSPRLSKRGC